MTVDYESLLGKYMNHVGRMYDKHALVDRPYPHPVSEDLFTEEEWDVLQAMAKIPEVFCQG